MFTINVRVACMDSPKALALTQYPHLAKYPHRRKFLTATFPLIRNESDIYLRELLSPWVSAKCMSVWEWASKWPKPLDGTIQTRLGRGRAEFLSLSTACWNPFGMLRCFKAANKSLIDATPIWRVVILLKKQKNYLLKLPNHIEWSVTLLLWQPSWYEIWSSNIFSKESGFKLDYHDSNLL